MELWSCKEMRLGPLVGLVDVDRSTRLGSGLERSVASLNLPRCSLYDGG